MEKKHACERDFFEVMLQEEQNSARREHIRTLSKESQEDRLFELKVLKTTGIHCQFSAVCISTVKKKDNISYSLSNFFCWY